MPLTEVVALGATEFYKKLHALDAHIARLKDAHTIKVEHWAWGATGNYGVMLRLEGEHKRVVQAAALDFMERERQKILDELKRFGFDEA